MHIQLYDKQILGSDELIGEAEIDFTSVAKFAYEENIRQNVKLITSEDGSQEFERVE